MARAEQMKRGESMEWKSSITVGFAILVLLLSFGAALADVHYY